MPPIHLPPSAVCVSSEAELKAPGPADTRDRSALVGGEETFGSGGFLDGRASTCDARFTHRPRHTFGRGTRVRTHASAARQEGDEEKNSGDTGDRKGQVYCVLERTCHNRK